MAVSRHTPLCRAFAARRQARVWARPGGLLGRTVLRWGRMSPCAWMRPGCGRARLRCASASSPGFPGSDFRAVPSRLPPPSSPPWCERPEGGPRDPRGRAEFVLGPVPCRRLPASSRRAGGCRPHGGTMSFPARPWALAGRAGGAARAVRGLRGGWGASRDAARVLRLAGSTNPRWVGRSGACSLRRASPSGTCSTSSRAGSCPAGLPARRTAYGLSASAASARGDGRPLGAVGAAAGPSAGPARDALARSARRPVSGTGGCSSLAEAPPLWNADSAFWHTDEEPADRTVHRVRRHAVVDAAAGGTVADGTGASCERPERHPVQRSRRHWEMAGRGLVESAVGAVRTRISSARAG